MWNIYIYKKDYFLPKCGQCKTHALRSLITNTDTVFWRREYVPVEKCFSALTCKSFVIKRLLRRNHLLGFCRWSSLQQGLGEPAAPWNKSPAGGKTWKLIWKAATGTIHPVYIIVLKDRNVPVGKEWLPVLKMSWEAGEQQVLEAFLGKIGQFLFCPASPPRSFNELMFSSILFYF